jgi:hypothetical protein
MKNTLFIVSVYAPDLERQQMVRDLVYYLKQNQKDILLLSHTLLPQDIIDSSNYYFYDERNEIYLDERFKWKYFFDINGNYMIESSLVCPNFSTLLPVYNFILQGIMISKVLGYEYIHYMEYDFSINNLGLLDKNIEYLQDNDVVLYKHDVDGYGVLLGYMCLKLLNFQLNELYFSKENLLNEYLNYNLKVENFLFDLFFKHKNHLIKDYDSILEFLIPSQYQSSKKEYKEPLFPLVYKEKENYDHEDLFWAVNNSKDKVLNFSIIVNNTTIHNLQINPYLSELGGLGSLENIHNIKFLYENKIVKEYNLETQKQKITLMENTKLIKLT